MLALAHVPLLLMTANAPAFPVGAVAFTVDAVAVVRAQPADDGAPVRELPIWTPVRVDVVSPDAAWVKVTIGPRVFRYDTPGGEAKPTAPSSFADSGGVGWLKTTSLDAVPTSRLGLVARSKDAPENERKLWLMRAYALDPNDPEVKKAVAPSIHVVTGRAHSPFERADLVAGCRGDLTRARVVVASLNPIGADPPDACASHVDLRRPCGADQSAARTALARFEPRYAKDGPALRLSAIKGAADRPIYVVTRLLNGECSADCSPVATTSDVRVDRLRVPVVDDGRTVLHVLVPRYTGALYDVVMDPPDADGGSFDLGELFDVDPRDDPPAGDHMFIAPDACCSRSCSEGDEP